MEANLNKCGRIILPQMYFKFVILSISNITWLQVFASFARMPERKISSIKIHFSSLVQKCSKCPILRFEWPFCVQGFHILFKRIGNLKWLFVQWVTSCPINCFSTFPMTLIDCDVVAFARDSVNLISELSNSKFWRVFNHQSWRIGDLSLLPAGPVKNRISINQQGKHFCLSFDVAVKKSWFWLSVKTMFESCQSTICTKVVFLPRWLRNLVSQIL